MNRSFTLEHPHGDAPANQLRKDPSASRRRRPVTIAEVTELGLISTALICGCLGLEAFVNW